MMHVERRLLDISVGANMRGMCSACNKKSFRWEKWIHVEEWHRNHKCVDGALTRKNGYREVPMDKLTEQLATLQEVADDLYRALVQMKSRRGIDIDDADLVISALENYENNVVR
jgi:hypothetical protein